MSLHHLPQEIKELIESEPDEKYRIALMYQYLIAGRVSEVSGIYRPSRNDVTKVTVEIGKEEKEAVLFKIKSQHTNIDIRYVMLPIDPENDPWVEMVYEYIQEQESEYPFQLSEDIGTSKTYLMKKAGELFHSLKWVSPGYVDSKTGNFVEERVNQFTSDNLRELRTIELVKRHNFSETDIALCGISFSNLRGYRGIEIKRIKEEPLSDYSTNEIIERAIPYFKKLISFNEEMQSIRIPWNVSECYFAVWGYDKIDSEDDIVKIHVAREIAELIGRSVKSVEYKFQNVAHFDLRPYGEKPYAPARNAQKLLGEVFDWYWQDREEARSKFNDFLDILDVDDSTTFSQGYDAVKKVKENILVEEGEIKYSAFKHRKRSAKLLKAAREHFREQDHEGKLRCASCGYTKPDSIIREIVHIHHTEPLSDIDKNGQQLDLSQAIGKLIPLCPNCHSLAHSRKTPLTLRELQYL